MELLGDTVIVLASQVVFFLVGWIFFVKMLFRDYELHHSLVQLIFCVNFTLSCTMFELIIFEIVSFLDKNSRSVEIITFIIRFLKLKVNHFLFLLNGFGVWY